MIQFIDTRIAKTPRPQGDHMGIGHFFHILKRILLPPDIKKVQQCPGHALLIP